MMAAAEIMAFHLIMTRDSLAGRGGSSDIAKFVFIDGFLWGLSCGRREMRFNPLPSDTIQSTASSFEIPVI